MELSITAVSANRKMVKALFRTPAFSDRLEELVAPLSHPDWDILQMVIHDDPSSFVEVRKIDGRFVQVAVGAPVGSFLPPDDATFVDGLAAQMSLVIRHAPMKESLRMELLKCVEQARVETRDKSIPHSPLSAKFKQSQ